MAIPLAAILLCTAGLRPSDPVSELPQARIDDLFSDYDRPGAPGASILISRSGHIVHERSFGLANLERGVRATSDTHYRLASLTKQFTAAAALILAARGRLSWDDPVRKWLPELPPYARDVRIRHLATHSSGLPDYEDLMPADQRAQLSDSDVPRLLAGAEELLFPPGSRFQYSNTGYALLSLVIAKASRRPFRDFLREAIFRPLGMSAVVPREPASESAPIPHRAFGYTRTEGRWGRTDQSSTSAVEGDGGIYASAHDLALWSQALDGGGRLRASLPDAFVPRIPAPEEKASYGLGWFVGELAGRRVVWHSGTTVGFRNAILHCREAALTVVVLTNRNEGEPLEAAREIFRLAAPPHDAGLRTPATR